MSSNDDDRHSVLSEDPDLYLAEEDLLDFDNEDSNVDDVSVSYQIPRTQNEIETNSVDYSAMQEIKRIAPILRSRVLKALRCSTENIDSITGGELFDVSFAESFLDELLRVVNSGLGEMDRPRCSPAEWKRAIGVVAACGFYQTSFEDLTKRENADVYRFGSFNVSRVRNIICGLGIRASDFAESRGNVVSSYDRDINYVGEAFAKVCCSLFYVHEMTFSADDEVTRQRSNDLSPSTGLRQVNLAKARGAQQTTLSNPLTNLTLCSRYACSKEPIQSTLGILLRRLQGHSDVKFCNFRYDSTIYIDRVYVSDDVVSMIYELGMHVVGTQKRGPQAPFTYGTSKQYRNTKRIEELGIMSSYWAVRKRKKAVTTYHLAFRESSSTKGRVAMLITTRRDLAGNKWVSKNSNMNSNLSNTCELTVVFPGRSEIVGPALEVFSDRVFDELESKIRVLTQGQSARDRFWFLARGLHFTSTTSLSILELIAKRTPDAFKESYDNHYLAKVLGLSLSQAFPEDESFEAIAIEVTDKMNVAELKQECKKRKIPGYSTKNKQSLQQLLAEWTPHTERRLFFEEEVVRLALRSWCFKPQKATEAMQAGSRNEKVIAELLPAFLLEHAQLVTLSARLYGLVKRNSRPYEHMATSPDIVAVLMTAFDYQSRENTSSENLCSSNCSAEAYVYEMKTFSGKESVGQAYEVREKHGRFSRISIGHIGEENNSILSEGDIDILATEFQSHVPWKEYRYQIIHHAAVCGCKVIFVAATRSAIIFAVEISVSASIIEALARLLRTIRNIYILWSFLPIENISTINSSVIEFGTDQQSVYTYLNLVSSFHSTVKAKGILPASKYIKPKLITQWNTHKGGTDVMSRVISNSPFKMNKMTARGTILWRFVQMMFVNCTYLLRTVKISEDNFCSYIHWRKQGANMIPFRSVLKSIFQRLLQEKDLLTRQRSRDTFVAHIGSSKGRKNIRIRSNSCSAKTLHARRLEK